MAAGAYAGYLLEFDDQTGETSGYGVALAAEVRRLLLKQTNGQMSTGTERWKMTFPFDPKGEKIRTGSWRKLGLPAVAVSGLDAGTAIVSPFVENVLAEGVQDSQGRAFQCVSSSVPEPYLTPTKKVINYSVWVCFCSCQTSIDSTFRSVGYDETLMYGISPEAPPNPPFELASQVVFSTASLKGSFDLP